MVQPIVRTLFRFGAFYLFFLTAHAYAQLSIPNHYEEPGIYPGREYVNQHFGEHIDPFQGSLGLHYVDIHLPGNGGFDLNVERSYNLRGAWTALSPFGRGWQIHFGRVKRPGEQTACGVFPTARLMLELPDGSIQAIYTSSVPGAPNYISSGYWKAQCILGGGGVAVTSPTGTRYEATDGSGEYWNVTKIIDRNGNSATITYTTIANTGQRVVSSVTTSDSRTLNFNYNATSLIGITANGRTWTYNVTNFGTALGIDNRLVSVTPPTGAAWQYEYYGFRGTVAGSFAMRQVTYPQGGTITYDYGWVTFLQGVVGVTPTAVVTSKATSDGTWTYSYEPSSNLSGGSYDVTTVTRPSGLGTITYKHFGYWTVGPNENYKVGLLYQKSTGNAQVETFTWGSQVISPELFARSGYVGIDGNVKRPLLASHSVSRDGGATFTTSYSNRDTHGNPQTIAESGSASRTRNLTYANLTSPWIIGLTSEDAITGVGTISKTYGADGNLLSQNNFGVNQTFAYDNAGNMTASTNARGFMTSYSNFYRGVARTENRPEGVTISRGVDWFGNVTSASDGVSTKNYGYDALNRLTSIDFPAGNSVAISWTPSARTQSISRGAYSASNSFDHFGRKTSENKGGIVVNYDLDALGRIVFQSLPGSAAGATYTLDVLGRKTSIVRPEGTTSISYAGSSVTVTNPRGFATRYGYARFGNPDEGFLTSVSPLSAPATGISLQKNDLGRLNAVTQNGITRNYGYNTRHHLTSIDDPETGLTSFGRDSVGNLTSRSVGGVTTTYSYDGLNRLTNINYSDTLTGDVSLGYNGRSQVTSVVNSHASRTYQYDPNGNLSAETLSVGGNDFTLDYTHDLLDGLSSVSYPLQKGTVNYSPNALGRPTAASPYASSITHFSSGNLSSLRFGNGSSQSYNEDSSQRPTSVGGNVGYTYAYDGAGNVTQILDGNNSVGSRNFTYDPVDRLTGITSSGGSENFAYSGTGNLTNKTTAGTQIGYTYGTSSQRLVNISVGGTNSPTYAYDGFGNLTSDGVNIYTYNHASSMTCSNCGTPREIKYAHDGKGQRVYEEKNGNRTYFVYGANGKLLFEYARFGKKWKKHIYVHNQRIATQTGSDASISTATLGANPTSGVEGGSVTLTATVTPTSATGTVTFKSGTTDVGTVPLVSGRATLAITTLPIGTNSIQAFYSGSADVLPSTSPKVSVTVNAPPPPPVTPTISLTSSSTSLALGLAPTLTITVNGTPTPTGQVEFLRDTAVVATTTLAGGTASHTAALMPAGTYSYSARYLGGPGYTAATSSPVSVTINRVLPVFTLQTGTPANSVFGNTVALAAQPQAVGGFTPTGSVTFKNHGVAITTVEVTGAATAIFPALAAGSYSWVAEYSGDSNYLPATSSALALTISQATPTVSLAPLPAPALSNRDLALTVTVAGPPPTTQPTGQVRLMVNGAQVAQSAVSAGAVQFSIKLPVGTHTLRADYLGDNNYAPTSSATASLTVTISPEDLAAVLSILLNDED